MITRIEIDGFKSFYKFSLDLQPFQVIIGPNAAGKSNLFDAMMLLSRLASQDLRSAFQESRGEAGELFTLLPGDHSRNEMSFAVEMLLEPSIVDSWGKNAEVTHTRVRYELKIVRTTDQRGLEYLKVGYERLSPIAPSFDTWTTNEMRKLWPRHFKYQRKKDLIGTELEHKSGKPTIVIRQDNKSGRQREIVVERMESTILSGLNNTEFAIAFAVSEELRGWKFLQLSPESLRSSKSRIASDQLSPSGENLANMLMRLKKEDEFVINDISTDLGNLVNGVMDIDIDEDDVRDRYNVTIKFSDERKFSSGVLSDGTLRMLALASLKYDSKHGGVLLFEEPENGVHPFRIKRLVPLLRELATDFSVEPDSEIDEAPKLRQLIVNTHSTKVLYQLHDKEIVFAHVTESIIDGQSMRVTQMSPVQYSLVTSSENSFTLMELKRYLDDSDIEEARRKRGN